jgi:hypothetical protein
MLLFILQNSPLIKPIWMIVMQLFQSWKCYVETFIYLNLFIVSFITHLGHKQLYLLNP